MPVAKELRAKFQAIERDIRDAHKFGEKPPGYSLSGWLRELNADKRELLRGVRVKQIARVHYEQHEARKKKYLKPINLR